MSSRLRSLIMVAVVWQLCCLALILVYRPSIGRAVGAAYARSSGDIQANFGSYERVCTYLAIVLVTTPATVVSLGLLNALMPPQRSRRYRVLAFGVWQAAVVAALVWSYEIGFPYIVHRIDWTLFGPAEIYSFRNLMLPRIIAWMVCTMPPICAAWWLFSRCVRPESSGTHSR